MRKSGLSLPLRYECSSFAIAGVEQGRAVRRRIAIEIVAIPDEISPPYQIHHPRDQICDPDNVPGKTEAVPEDDVQPLVVCLPAELYIELKERARDDNLPMSQLVRRAVREYLNRSAVARLGLNLRP